MNSTIRFPCHKDERSAVCDDIVKELFKRNWKIPECQVKFTYNVKNKIADVWDIVFFQSDKIICKLWFYEMGIGDNASPIHEIGFISKGVLEDVYKTFSIFGDESGSLEIIGGPYSGKYSLGYNKSGYGRSRTYEWNTNHFTKPKDKKTFQYHDLVKESIEYLTNIILPLVKSYPIPDLDPTCLNQPYIPVPDDIPDMFMFGGILIQKNVLTNAPIYHNTDWITIKNDDTEWGDYSYRKIGIGEINPDESWEDYNIPDYMNWNDKCVIKVVLDDAFGVSVIDYQAYIDKRIEMSNATTADSFTDDEVKEMNKCKIDTRVSITNDKWRQYKSPVIYVSRALKPNELSVVIPYK
jgi:hypothetical protein